MIYTKFLIFKLGTMALTVIFMFLGMITSGSKSRTEKKELNTRLSSLESCHNGSQKGTIAIVSKRLRFIFEGKPHFNFFLPQKSVTRPAYEIDFVSLSEVTPEGQLVKNYLFEQVHGWKNSFQYYETLKLLKLKICSELEIETSTPPLTISVPVIIQISTFFDTAEFGYGDSTFTVPLNLFKFRIEIGTWPFDSSANQLALSIKITTNLASQISHNPNTGTYVATHAKDASIAVVNPRHASLDGNVTTIQTISHKIGGKHNLEIFFPHYEKKLMYTPIFSFISSKASD
ncbi:MAG: hypothetical protein ACFFBD_06270 [Candidatus Hodarchaeota archaeon]